jgi:hypothetical protein
MQAAVVQGDVAGRTLYPVLLGEDELAERCQAQSVDGLTVLDLDFLLMPKQFGAAPASMARRAKRQGR